MSLLVFCLKNKVWKLCAGRSFIWPFDFFAVWKETPLSANSVKPGMLHRISCLNHEHLLRVRHHSSVKRLTAKRRRDFFLGSDNKGTKKTWVFPQKNREEKRQRQKKHGMLGQKISSCDLRIYPKCPSREQPLKHHSDVQGWFCFSNMKTE